MFPANRLEDLTRATGHGWAHGGAGAVVGYGLVVGVVIGFVAGWLSGWLIVSVTDNTRTTSSPVSSVPGSDG